MLIDKPCCDFQECKHHFDGNCMDKIEYERCPYNRQRAENEKLKAKVKKLENIERYADKLIKKQETEIKNLTISCSNFENALKSLKRIEKKAINEIKSEAIKEFAERLKAKGDRYAWVVGISKDEINNLVKEMTEVSENE